MRRYLKDHSIRFNFYVKVIMLDKVIQILINWYVLGVLMRLLLTIQEIVFKKVVFTITLIQFWMWQFQKVIFLLVVIIKTINFTAKSFDQNYQITLINHLLQFGIKLLLYATEPQHFNTAIQFITQRINFLLTISDYLWFGFTKLLVLNLP